MVQLKSLRLKLGFVLIIPVFFIIVFAGGIIFFQARDKMLEQWHESARLKLGVAARLIQGRLLKTVDLINVLINADHPDSAGIKPQRLIKLINSMDGIIDVAYTKPNALDHKENADRTVKVTHRRLRSSIRHISAPAYGADKGQKSVFINLDLMDTAGRILGHLKIRMGVVYLLSDITRLGWWQYDLACIINQEGGYIAQSRMEADQDVKIDENQKFVESRILSKMAAIPFGIVTSGGHPPELIAGFYKMDQVPWTIVMFAHGQKVLEPIVFYRNMIALVSLLVLLAVAFLIHNSVGKILDQIERLAGAAENVTKGGYADPIPVLGHDEMGQLTQSFNTMTEGLKQRDSIRDFFGRYVDPEFAASLLAHPEAGKLGGERRQVVIMMSDIRGFTPLSEAHSPEIIIEVLNQYFSRMIDIIIRHKGIIVDFCGDAILTYFEPLASSLDRTAFKSMACAMEMQHQMATFNTEMADKGLPELSMGIGIHAGPAVVGNIGSKTRTKFGIVGSAVNITSRIQEVAGKNEIMVSESLCTCLSQQGRQTPKINRSVIVHLKGVDKAMKLHAIQWTDGTTVK